MKFESQGVMVSIEEAIEILSERIPKSITSQGAVFEETYNKAVRRAIYHMKKGSAGKAEIPQRQTGAVLLDLRHLRERCRCKR